MKQWQIETVRITLMSDNAQLFTYNLVVQYSTPSYYHKTFESKLDCKNLAAELFSFALTE